MLEEEKASKGERWVPRGVRLDICRSCPRSTSVIVVRLITYSGSDIDAQTARTCPTAVDRTVHTSTLLDNHAHVYTWYT